MGMDVYGTDCDGNELYFRASVWSWRPIMAVMENLNEMFGYGLESTLETMHYNDGNGFEDAETCQNFGAAILEYCDITSDTSLSLPCEGMQVDPNTGQFVAEGGVSPYRVDREHLREWGEFLMKCDDSGFKVF